MFEESPQKEDTVRDDYTVVNVITCVQLIGEIKDATEMQDDVSGYKTKNIKLHLEVMSNISRVFLVPYLLTLEFFRIFFPDGRILRPIRNVQEEETCN